MKLVVVIPAYNEAKVIEAVLASIPKQIAGVSKITAVVVDDNSNDNTRERVEKAGAICVRHELNLGAGGATVTGFELAKKLDADIVVTMDGDGQHAGEEIEHLVRPIINNEVDVVIGSRLMGEREQMSTMKLLGNNLLNIVTYLFFRIWVSDSQSGFKALSRKALNEITLSTTGYEFCSEFIGEIKAHKLKYKEVPVSTIYTDYSRGKGQMALNAVNIVTGLATRKLK